MKINKNRKELKEKSEKNVLIEKGIKKRQISSIQTEVHFEDIKENNGIRKFNDCLKEKIYKEIMFYVMGRNINKYHRFIKGTMTKLESKIIEKTA